MTRINYTSKLKLLSMLLYFQKYKVSFFAILICLCSCHDYKNFYCDNLKRNIRVPKRKDKAAQFYENQFSLGLSFKTIDGITKKLSLGGISLRDSLYISRTTEQIKNYYFDRMKEREQILKIIEGDPCDSANRRAALKIQAVMSSGAQKYEELNLITSSLTSSPKEDLNEKLDNIYSKLDEIGKGISKSYIPLKSDMAFYDDEKAKSLRKSKIYLIKPVDKSNLELKEKQNKSIFSDIYFSSSGKQNFQDQKFGGIFLNPKKSFNIDQYSEVGYKWLLSADLISVRKASKYLFGVIINGNETDDSCIGFSIEQNEGQKFPKIVIRGPFNDSLKKHPIIYEKEVYYDVDKKIQFKVLSDKRELFFYINDDLIALTSDYLIDNVIAKVVNEGEEPILILESSRGYRK